MLLRYPIEIKLTVEDKVTHAIKALGLNSGAPLRIWFLEDTTPGVPTPLPLLRAGVILRLRRKEDEGDSTVKLRPCRRSQLTALWSMKAEDGQWEQRMEDDWAGKRHVLAASSVLTQSPDTIAQVASNEASVRAAFDPRQLQFLAECADLRIDVSPLTVLGPISATRWKGVNLNNQASPEHADTLKSVSVERWTVADLDFLELSIRLKGGFDGDPTAVQTAFEHAMREHGVEFASEHKPKTTKVLESLAARLPVQT